MKIPSKKKEPVDLNKQTIKLLKEIVSGFSDYKRLAQGTNKCDLIIRAENLLEKLNKQ